MNEFLAATKEALKLHGKPAVYSRVASGVYNIESGAQTNTSSNTTVQMYKKHIRANQYNFPDLIGRDAAMFYIAADSLAFIPGFKDIITFDSIKYVVQSYVEHAAKGQVVLLKILAVKG